MSQQQPAYRNIYAANALTFPKLNKKAQLMQGLRRAVIPRWLTAAILDFIEPEIAPFDPPTPKTLA